MDDQLGIPYHNQRCGACDRIAREHSNPRDCTGFVFVQSRFDAITAENNAQYQRELASLMEKYGRSTP